MNNQSEQILTAAYTCISTKGYANVSLREIAIEAGVALSQLHYYYGSKKDLFKAVILKVIRQYLHEFEEFLQKNKNSISDIGNLVTYVQSMIVENPELFRIFYDLSSLALWSESFKTLLTDLFKDLTLVIEECLDVSQMNEALRAYSPNAIARIILGAIFGVGLQYSLDPKSNSEMVQTLSVVPDIII